MHQPETTPSAVADHLASDQSLPTRMTCCIAGCEPAKAVMALLLARAGIDILVLEKHGDFLRDFRGDTIHPSTLEILDEMGLTERFLQLPHSEVAELGGQIPGGARITFTLARLKTKFPFIAFVPQWDFLTFITGEAARYPNFRLLLHAEGVALISKPSGGAGVGSRE